jgi:putative membrane protein
MGEYGGYGMGGYALWGGLMMVLFWGVVIVFIVAVVRWLVGGSAGRHPHLHERSNRALEILEERYARGEIEREEYLQRRDDLKR